MSRNFIEPYLYFGGRCEEAIEFYRGAVGATVGALMRFSESPEPPPPDMLPPGFENKVMHAVIRIGDSTVMVSDGCGPAETPFSGFSLALQVPDVAEADRVFNALADGGQVQMPLDKTFWSPRFGMLTDRFGVAWAINVFVPPSPR